ncbi:probable G-protein coupled receptor 156 isoform X2 [Struthio camelus]|uniref:probable G-protein coupled receptor 156 isoform X2 n=1 Tax=Struthio camelus TaxID=8801 RepID=UPI00360415BB
MEPRLNCSDLCDGNSSFGSQEQQQRTLQELCTITVTSSDHSGKSSPSFSAALWGVVWTFLTGGVLLALFFLVFTIRFRKNRIVKMSSPNLNIVTLLGSGLTYSSAYLFGIQEQSLLSGESVEMLIQVRLCLLCVGSSLVFGPVLAKSWRLYKVFTQRVPDKRVIIKDLQLLAMVAALVLADTVLLLTWIFSDPVQCFRSLSVSLRVTEKGMTCSVNRMQSCASLYSDLWLILILGFKSILLLYGTYLAGLTDNVSCPPVNQSLTLIVGVNLIFLAAGTVFLVHRFFHAWHNLLFGFTSGGIFVCTTTINCFIFVPQLQQWKAFEEENQTVSHMAKYFTSPSRSCHSACSAEQLCQLMGEKSSMQRLLSEKNAVIESLQEQVNNAKEKLMRLMAAEYGCGPLAGAAPCAAFPSWSQSAGERGEWCSSAAAGNGVPLEHCPPEQNGWQSPSLLNAQCNSVPCSKLECSGDMEDLQKHMSHEHAPPEELACSQMLLFDVGKDILEYNPKGAQERKMSPRTGHPLQQLPGQELSAAGRGAEPQGSGGVTRAQSSRVNYVSSEKLQEILQELSLDGKINSPVSPQAPLRGSQGPPCERNGARRAQGSYLDRCTPLSPDLTRRGRRIPLPLPSAVFPGSMSPHAWCVVNKAVSRMRGGLSAWSHEESTSVSLEEGGDTGGRRLLYQLVPSASPVSTELCLQPEERQDWPEPQIQEASGAVSAVCPGAGQEQACEAFLHLLPPEWDAPREPAQPFPRSPCYYPDSDSSSSSEDIFHCCHRPYCELCFQGPLDSLDSSSTDTDTEPGGFAGDWAEHCGRSQPIVNFKEDLKPTFV